MSIKQRIIIDSILGGHSPSTHYASKDQFRSSFAIDPSFPLDDNLNAYSSLASGMIRPVASGVIGTTNGIPLWFLRNPKNTNGGDTYVYDSAGSVYSLDNNFTTVTGLRDLTDGGTATGNGGAYYDNYAYFSTATTIARYGPLDGSPSWTRDYWVTTLSKTALVNTTYPTPFLSLGAIPNHILHRHSDGKLYIGDVVGNQGTLHYIKTTKTTAEGDTDNGSLYSALTFGYGLWPTAIESYGENLAIALYEGSSNGNREMSAKIAFWDTTSTNANSIIFVEFPDQLITNMKNINGVLYITSCSLSGLVGFRLSRYIGGYSIEEIGYFEDGGVPYGGAVDGTSKRLLFGSTMSSPEAGAGVYSFGLQKAGISRGLFNTMRTTQNSVSVSALALIDNNLLLKDTPVIGWSNGSSSHGIDRVVTSDYSSANQMWWSQMYRIGQPFRINRIRFPLGQAVAANMIATPKIYYDDGAFSQTLTVINNTNFPNSERVANIKVNNNGTNQGMGQNNFWIEVKWTGSALLTLLLPIIIDIEIFPD